MTTNSKHLPYVLSLVCALISFTLDFFIIPSFFAKGVPDFIWMALMILLPTVAAVLLLRAVIKCKPSLVFIGLPLQFVIALVLFKPLSDLLGYNLGGFAEDFFSWVSYLIFTFGWAIGATLAQFLALLIAQKLDSKRTPD